MGAGLSYHSFNIFSKSIVAIFQSCTVFTDLSVFFVHWPFQTVSLPVRSGFFKTCAFFIEYKPWSCLLKGDLMHVYMIFSTECHPKLMGFIQSWI